MAAIISICVFPLLRLPLTGELEVRVEHYYADLEVSGCVYLFTTSGLHRRM